MKELKAVIMRKTDDYYICETLEGVTLNMPKRFFTFDVFIGMPILMKIVTGFSNKPELIIEPRKPEHTQEDLDFLKEVEGWING